MTALLGASCGAKKDFLDEKPSSDVFLPKSKVELQSLMDKSFFLNVMPELGTLSADEYYFEPGYWETLDSKERNSYIWAKDIFQGQPNIGDWNMPYKQVLQCNVVLDALEKNTIEDATEVELNYLKGAAFFVRGLAFYNVAVLFSDIFDDPSASAKPGIPIRLRPEVDEQSHRSNLGDTYKQIFSDLQQASLLLPDTIPVKARNRPSKPAIFAVLARIHLSNRSYEIAHQYADSCLKYYNKLIDYNKVDKNAFYPFKAQNDESIYFATMPVESKVLNGILQPLTVVDSNLYNSYDVNDLRKNIFFLMNGANHPNFKGGYSGSAFSYAGVATDEVVLIKAECLARERKTEDAIDMLNLLLKNRIDKNKFKPLQANTPEDALQLILNERKKELVMRGLRWTDLKRYNKENRNSVLTRKLNGLTYYLAPNDSKYLLPIPPDVIALSGIPQNER
ncbi:RagB/SusD family nutrient uptake outer membrane protein [Pseudoflavitalea sp. G-6-1-2]|uniref:RagB/SusD family nutrient uptake outer membrane protein n=1 Tax=Pseudoflavitalea sp. G-6-1-2 TaxID=2728841 RepID=UPI00146AB604|nr:RagB/SusD family nutrient uptake outer membrane protein [Pseudoflavitalea sp. G-6-1-2]NML22089.1 RagB/SusD family nutrient uptake outer membrane protein [Pseudoflavitalea sp. G-6-1-2]